MENHVRQLDFEQWRLLASRDPEEFENRRKALIDAVISRAPERRQQRLRGLQWRVDQVRNRSSNALAACISLSDMMWESFAGSNGLVETLQRAKDEPPTREQESNRASVISLGKKPLKPS
jgi:hypothetical protein